MKKAKKQKDNKVEYGTISLPQPLIDKVKERIKGTGMTSVSAYISFILREVLASSKKPEEKFKEIKEKLKILGY